MTDQVVGAVVVSGVHRGERRVVAILGEAVLVHLEHVVRVHEVLVEQFPVGVPHIDLTMHRHIAGHAVATNDFGQRRKARTKYAGVGVLRDEQESLPLFEPQGR